jgi:hypothetical protein
MKKLTLKDAEKLFQIKVSRGKGIENMENPPKIISIDYYPWGWIFHYNSRAFLEDGDDSKAYLPAAPVLVDKIDSTVDYIPIGHPFFDTGRLVLDYELGKGYDKLKNK